MENFTGNEETQKGSLQNFEKVRNFFSEFEDMDEEEIDKFSENQHIQFPVEKIALSLDDYRFREQTTILFAKYFNQVEDGSILRNQKIINGIKDTVLGYKDFFNIPELEKNAILEKLQADMVLREKNHFLLRKIVSECKSPAEMTTLLPVIEEYFFKNDTVIKDTIAYYGETLDAILYNTQETDLKKRVKYATERIFSKIEELYQKGKLRFSSTEEDDVYMDEGEYDIGTSGFVRDIAVKKLDEHYFRHHGIHFIDMENSEMLWGSIQLDIERMAELEKELPGSVKILQKEYGIRSFGRYPASMLLRQLEEKEKQKPYGTIIFPYEDHNGAFHQERREFFPSLSEQLGDTYGVRIFETGSKIGIARILIGLDQTYGEKNKASFLILGGHGSPESIGIGAYDFDSKDRDLGSISKEDALSPRIRRTADFFDKDATIILLSCSTGVKGGIAEKLSENLQRKVIAPNKDTNADTITVSFDNGKPVFMVTYTKGAKPMLYSPKPNMNMKDAQA